MPDRTEDLAKDVKQLKDAIRQLANVLDDSNNFQQKKDPAEIVMIKSKNGDDLNLSFNKDFIRDLIDTAIDLDEVVKAGRNLSMDDSALFDFGSNNKQPREKTHPLAGEKGSLQMEFDQAKDNFKQISEKPKVRKWLDANSPLNKLALDINAQASSVFYVHEPSFAREELEKDLEEFISIAQGKLMDNQDISAIPQMLPTHRSNDTVSQYPFDQKEILKHKILKNLKEERPIVGKTQKGAIQVPVINNLIEQIEMMEDIPLDTLKKLKELGREIDR